MRKTILFILMLVAGIATAVAAERSEGDALAIARQKAAALGIKMPQTSNGSARAKGISTSNASPYYIFSGEEGKGFVVVAGDDRMGEVIAYSATSSLPDIESKEYEGTTLRLLFDGFRNMAAALKAGDTEVEARAREARQLASGGYEAVEPLIGNVYWNQMEPYNRYCPIACDGKPSPVGCVAQAYATVMKYWSHPKQLLADIPAYTTKTRGYEMEAVGAGCEYRWDKMRETYKEGEYSEEEADAVATLLSHVGRAFEMDYDNNEDDGSPDFFTASGASEINVKNFFRCFGYDEDTYELLDYNSMPLPEIRSRLNSELLAGRPMVVSGYSNGFGHAWVCDGMDSQGLLRLLVGWTGKGGKEELFDLYCDILTMGSVLGKTGDIVAGVCSGINFIVGLQPDNGVKDEVRPRANYIFYYNFAHLYEDEATRESADQPFVADMNILVNKLIYDGKESTDSIAVAIKDADGNYEIISEPLPIKYVDGDMKSIQIFPKINYVLPEGEYQTYLLCKNYGTDSWIEFDGCEMVMPVFSVTSTLLTQVSPNVKVSIEADNGLAMIFENNDDRDFQRYIDLTFYGTSFNTIKNYCFSVFVPAHGTSRRFLLTDNMGVDKAFVSMHDYNFYYFRGEVALKNFNNVLHVISNTMNLSERLTDVETPFGTLTLQTVDDDVINVSFAVRNEGEASTIQAEIVVSDEIAGEIAAKFPVTRDFGENEEGDIKCSLDRKDLDLTGRMVSVTLRLVTGAAEMLSEKDGSCTDVINKDFGITSKSPTITLIFYWAGSTTSIGSLSADGEAAEFYDLRGMRLKEAKKGIYIKGGKKVVK